MAVKFVPIGVLDTTTDPSSLPSQIVGKDEVSGAMQRCTNLTLEYPGSARTRKGAEKLNQTALGETSAWLLLEMGGNRYEFSGTRIYRNETSIQTGLTNARWSGIVYNAYNTDVSSIFASNGTDRKRVTGSTVADWGIEAPAAAPTIAGINYVTTATWEGTYYTLAQLFTTLGTGTAAGYYRVYPWETIFTSFPSDHPEVTTLTRYGTYYFDTNSTLTEFGVVYTYCRKVSGVLEAESNPSPAGTIYQNSGLKVSWTTPSDAQVTHVRIYRTLAGGTTYYYAKEAAYNASPVILDTLDAALGAEVAYDHDRPPEGITAISGPTFNGYMFGVVGNKMYFCKPNQPEYWPVDFYIEIGSPEYPLTALELFGGSVYAANRYEMQMIQGTGSASFFPFPIVGSKGCVGDHAIASVSGAGIYHVASDGIYLFQGGIDNRISDAGFKDLFLGITAGCVPGINKGAMDNCFLFHYENTVWFGYPAVGSSFPNNLLVIFLLQERTVHYDYGQTFRCIGLDRTNDRILAIDASGYVWQLEKGDSDNGTEIAWDLQTKDYTDRAAKYMPRAAKYDVELTRGTASSEIMLNGATVQTHPIITSRKTRRRLIDGANGDRLSVRMMGAGVVNIREIIVE